jgi:hypothetical protein
MVASSVGSNFSVVALIRLFHMFTSDGIAILFCERLPSAQDCPFASFEFHVIEIEFRKLFDHWLFS